MLGESGVFYRHFRIHHDCGQARTFQRLRKVVVDFRQLGQRRIKVDQFRQRRRAFAVADFVVRGGDDQRDSRIEFEVRRLAPQRVLTNVKAVIRRKNNDRVVCLAAFVEGVENLADLRIQETDLSKVAVAVMPNFILGEITILRRETITANLARLVQRDVRHVVRRGGRIGHRDLFRLIKIPVLLRSHKRQVRPPEADSQKERLLTSGMITQHRRRQVGDLPVSIGRVGDVVSFRHFCLVRSRPARPRSVCENRVVSMSPFEQDFVDRPRTAILSFAHVVKQLANVLAEVTMILEMLRQRDERAAAGRGLAKILPQVIHADGVWSQPGQKRRPRRITNRLLTISSLKRHSASRQ